MLHLESDYVAGAHPEVLDALVRSNAEALSGYGTDPHTARAVELVRRELDAPDAEVLLLVGGTQTNQVLIDALLRPWEGVLAAETGHIATHEAGAIEHSGHKVLTLPSREGRIDAADLREWMETFTADPNSPHMVQPGLVYVSQPTEYGTLYSEADLEALREVCDEHGLRLFVDGARLSYALTSPDNDLSAPRLAALADALTIGGTKVGALCGEALVAPRGGLPAHFVTAVKQKGALLAKGRLLGVQFTALLEEGLHLRIGRRANELARRLTDGLGALGCDLAIPTRSNQVFPVLDDEVLTRLGEEAAVTVWERADATRTVVRLASGWSTTAEEIDAFLAALARALREVGSAREEER